MHFELDADQRQLQDSLRRLLDSEASFEKRRAAAATPRGWNAAVWRSLAEMGVIAIALPEAHGGFGQRPVALLPVLQELGRALTLEPFLATAVLGATAVAHAGTAEQKNNVLGAVASASQLLAFAHEERAGRHSRLWVESTARAATEGEDCTRGANGWVLDGVKHNVLHGDAADTLVVSARTGGGSDEPAGVALFLVKADQPGVQRTALRLIDDTPAAEIRFASAKAQRLGNNVEAGVDIGVDIAGWNSIVAVQEAGIAAVCAEALGVAQRAYEMTVEYVQTRQQFGRAIGANQALRHRVAEMRVALDMVRSAALAGLLALEIEDAALRSRELSRAKMLVSRHGVFIAQQGIQLHGGMGMTVEYAVGHCLRRMTVLDQLFGDGASHAARLGAALAMDAVSKQEASRAT